ncbi:MAG: GIY-YIG nuclease family protein [Bryobacteraceae bacterium]
MAVDKRAARREFKAKKVFKGVFAVRCKASGKVWVSTSQNLEASHTSLWFQLRNQSGLNKALQAEWNAHGEPAFAYEVLERLAEDISPLLIRDTLRDRQKHWQQELGAALV